MQVMCCNTCHLCGKPCAHFAKAHILPWGFFKQRKEYTDVGSQVYSYDNNGRMRKLRKLLYDKELICDDCEHAIFSPLDDYAIRIYNAMEGAKKIDLENREKIPRAAKLIIYPTVDRRKLRMFFASVLWRCHISSQKELKDLEIGEYYAEKIRRDLIDKKEMNYIDAIGFRLTSFEHIAIVLPHKERLKDKNKVANGFNIQFPGLLFKVSLDQRENPYDYGAIQLDAFYEDFVGDGSFSLNDKYEKKALMLFQAERADWQRGLLQRILSRDNILKLNRQERSFN